MTNIRQSADKATLASPLDVLKEHYAAKLVDASDQAQIERIMSDLGRTVLSAFKPRRTDDNDSIRSLSSHDNEVVDMITANAVNSAVLMVLGVDPNSVVNAMSGSNISVS